MFDLDLTLLEGDTDQLWCMYLIERGLLGKEMERIMRLAAAI